MKYKPLFVNIKSPKMLPKLSDTQLDTLALRIGLTLDQLKRLQEAAHQTYQEIGADLEGGPHKREDIIEIVLDAGRLRHAIRDPELLKAYQQLNTHPLDHVYEAFAAGFPYARYE